MASFKEQATQAFATEDYRAKLSEYVRRYGYDIDPHVFELGVSLQRLIRAAEWAAWMKGATFYETMDEVVFTLPTEFRRQWVKNNYGFNIGVHLKKRVTFKLPDRQETFAWQESFV